MARKVGQIIRRGGRTWLVRVYNGHEVETKKRKYINQTFHGGRRGDFGEFLHPGERFWNHSNHTLVVAEDEVDAAVSDSLMVGKGHPRLARAEVAELVEFTFSLDGHLS